MTTARMRPFPPPIAPKATDGTAYVYVVQYSTGLIKVGWSKNPTDRIMKLHCLVTPFDITATSCWISQPHSHYLDSESILIGLSKRLGGEQRAVEYFNGVNPNTLLKEFGGLDTKCINPAGFSHPDLSAGEVAALARSRRNRLRGVVRS